LGAVLPDALTSRRARDAQFRALDAIVDAGCPTLDIAASYQLGGTERFLGQWMAERKNRDSLFLITKGGHPYPVVRPNRLSPNDITGDLHDSLRRLGVERVDLYLLHRDEPGAPLEPMLETLAMHQRAGKIAAYGVSNWTHGRIEALDALARRAGVPVPAASSPHFSLAMWSSVPWKGCVSIAGVGAEARAARAFYARHRLPVFAWSPLGRGFFCGAGADKTYASDANFARRRRAAILGEKYGISATQIAISYLTSQPFPVYAVVAVGGPENMQKNLAGAGIHLAEHELRWLETGGELTS
jgi:aryl-alcohol dehydrogenase-like predicted oxidoreductase